VRSSRPVEIDRALRKRQSEFLSGQISKACTVPLMKFAPWLGSLYVSGTTMSELWNAALSSS
jgi:hypothetical protein